MTDIAAAHGTAPKRVASGVLEASGALWFFTAVVGQWTFVYYIVGFYGPTMMSGDFAGWDRNRMLVDGHMPGDAVGNLFFLAHVALAAILTFGGALQLVPQIRSRAIAFHRLNGRLFMLASIAAAAGGLYLIWVRGTGARTGLPESIAVTLDAALIFAFSAFAWRAVRRKDIAVHQRWAIRLFLVVNGVWFVRVGLMAWLTLTQGAFGFRPFITIWSFAAYLAPLAIYELYWRARQGADGRAQLAMAGGMFALTLITGSGIAAAFLFLWRPLV